jgi:hypothetical protein
MVIRSRLLLVSVMTAAVLLVAVGSASARRLQLSTHLFLAIWTSLEFVIEGSSPILCPVTLEGSFHSRTLSKVSGQLIGYITKAKVQAVCTNGNASVLSETLPWHVRYSSFIGALPSITGVALQMVGMSMSIEEALGSCLWRTTASAPFSAILQLENGVARTLRADETGLIPLNEAGICEFFNLNLRYRGTAEAFVQGSTSTRITVRLVQ